MAPEALVEEYCRGVLPEVADRMKGFFGLLHSRVRHVETCDRLFREVGGSIREQRFTMLFAPTLLRRDAAARRDPGDARADKGGCA